MKKFPSDTEESLNELFKNFVENSRKFWELESKF